MSLLRRSLLLSIIAAFFLSNGSAFAAESVLLKYRIFRESLSVKELTNYAQTGELSTPLRINLALAKQDPKLIRQYLTESVISAKSYLWFHHLKPLPNLRRYYLNQWI
jgi:hypothetical protein